MLIKRLALAKDTLWYDCDIHVDQISHRNLGNIAETLKIYTSQWNPYLKPHASVLRIVSTNNVNTIEASYYLVYTMCWILLECVLECVLAYVTAAHDSFFLPERAKFQHLTFSSFKISVLYRGKMKTESKISVLGLLQVQLRQEFNVTAKGPGAGVLKVSIHGYYSRRSFVLYV